MASSRLIVADENIPMVREWFTPLGEVRTLPGRSMTAADVADADILLVRSVTPVGAKLLAGSRVRFVGTATIGTDHLDLDWLREAGIAVANAPGSNAQSVVDYVLGSLAAIDSLLERLIARDARVGVIGLGNVGGRLLRRLRQMDIDAAGYDPFVVALDLPQQPLEQLLKADVVCVHVPLTRTGDYPTFHMLDERRLVGLSAGALLLSAGRGPAIDNEALLRTLVQRPDLHCILDVWEDEPAISAPLLAAVALGTPHIAGYSLDGKLAGTRMLLEACDALFGRPDFAVTSTLDGVEINLALQGVAGLREALLAVYDPRRDDADLRDRLDGESLAARFDRLRKNYPVRREIAAVTIANAVELDRPTRHLLAAAGFRLD